MADNQKGVDEMKLTSPGNGRSSREFMRNQLKTLQKHFALGCKMEMEQSRRTPIRMIQKANISNICASETVYASAADFFRWKMLRVRDLLRGFLSLLTVRPRERPLDLSSAIYLSL